VGLLFLAVLAVLVLVCMRALVAEAQVIVLCALRQPG
jgi:hypothetical protein